MEKLCDCGCGKLVTRSPSLMKSRVYFSQACYQNAQRKQSLTSRICAKCGLTKSLADFHKRGKKSSRCHCYCKKCFNEVMVQKNHTIEYRFKHSKRQAKKRGIRWELTIKEFNLLIAQVCHYCGGSLGITGSSLDRKDNKIGYDMSNVVPCCGRCNFTKSDYFTYDEMREFLAPVLSQIRIKRGSNNALST